MRSIFSVFTMVTFFFCLVFLHTAFAGDDFPLRAKYQDVKIISTNQLAADYDKIIIIDVRSKMEFDVVHVNKAKHIAIATTGFLRSLENVRAKNSETLIAFYCNGHTCAKSYKAALKAAKEGFKNVVAYDSGIFDWVMASPERATLMGVSPASKDRIIPKAELKKKMLNYADFSIKAGEMDSFIIDIREPFQREKKLSFQGVRNLPLDKLLILLDQKKFQDKQILFADAVGKQVKWLQYHLVKNGYKNYYFLEKGLSAAP